ncbi:Crp/Fnr family transcriptional regulator [Bacteroidota bacterium]
MHKAPFFDMLSKDELELINKDRYSVHYRQGEMILKQGTTATHVLSLVGGVVKLYIEGIGDRNLFLSLISPTVLFAGPGIYTDRRVHYSAAAVTDVKVCFIDSNHFRKILETNAKFAHQIIIRASERAIGMYDKIVSLTQKQMHGRMADGLLYLANGFYKSNSFCLQISRQDIADMTAMSKDSAIRILKEFERDSIIALNGRALEILDMDHLYEVSQRG